MNYAFPIRRGSRVEALATDCKMFRRRCAVAQETVDFVVALTHNLTEDPAGSDRFLSGPRTSGAGGSIAASEMHQRCKSQPAAPELTR
jgi:hypothetical protein